MESLALCTIVTKENLVTFENNIIYKGDLPLVACMDFEATALTVSQLKDCAICVSQRRCKIVVAQMLWTELKFEADYYLMWFNRKFKSQHLEIDLGKKIACKNKIKNPINFDDYKCYICSISLLINTKGPHVSNPEMSYTDFYIRIEHIFLRNIYNREKQVPSAHLCTLGNYYKIFDNFLTVTILLESALNSNLTFDEIVDDRLTNFLKEKCTDCKNFEDLTKAINSNEVKHPAKDEKISKFTQTLYAFVYTHLIDSPELAISYEIVTATNFL